MKKKIIQLRKRNNNITFATNKKVHLYERTYFPTSV